jgi:hypothetical protein
MSQSQRFNRIPTKHEEDVAYREMQRISYKDSDAEAIDNRIGGQE